jgi:SagB-type dehydrogenase family enzyme
MARATAEEEEMGSAESARAFLTADLWEEWRNEETDQRRGVKPPAPQKPYPDDAVLVDLVGAQDLAVGRMPLIQAIGQRRSRRKYTEEPLSLEELSFLLWATQGVDLEATAAFREWLATALGVAVSEVTAILRTVPSGGSRHPFETYLVVNRVGELERGLYRYLSLEHKLLFLRGGPEVEQEAADAFPSWFQRSAVVFVWAAVPYRTAWRYGVVAPKMIAQESGHVCQNLYLASEAIGAGACAVGAYDQGKVDELLGLDGVEEFAIYVAPVGKAA